MTREEIVDGLERFLGNHQIYDDDAVENAINFLDDEQTPEDMLKALAVVGDMDTQDVIRFFDINAKLIRNSFDALYLLVNGGTPDMIFDAVEKYKEEKYKSKMEAQKNKVRLLAQEIGMHNLKDFTEQLEKEAAESRCRT